MVISTPLAELSDALVDDMVKAVSRGRTGAAGQHFLEPRLLIPESIF
jgi:LacI family transcriptional regulator